MLLEELAPLPLTAVVVHILGRNGFLLGSPYNIQTLPHIPPWSMILIQLFHYTTILVRESSDNAPNLTLDGHFIGSNGLITAVGGLQAYMVFFAKIFFQGNVFAV